MAGRRCTIDTLPGFKWKFGSLSRPDQHELARAIDRLPGDERSATAERVGGTKRLYRLQLGAWRLLFVREAERILLVTLETGRRPPARRRRPDG